MNIIDFAKNNVALIFLPIGAFAASRICVWCLARLGARKVAQHGATGVSPTTKSEDDRIHTDRALHYRGPPIAQAKPDDHRSKVRAGLTDLLDASRQQEAGFRLAAQNANNHSARSFYESRAEEAATGASQLKAIVEQLGGPIDESSRYAGALRPGWVDVKSAVLRHEVLDALDTNESLTMQLYRVVLDQELSDEIRATIARQYETAKANENKLRILRERHSEPEAD